MKTKLSIITAFAAAIGGVSAASVINVDFQPAGRANAVSYSGQAAAPGAGNTWNTVAVTTDSAASFGGNGGFLTADVSGMALVDSDGLATGVTLSVTNGNSTTADSNGAFASGTGVPAIAPGQYDLMRDYLIAFNGSTQTITLGGLSAGTLYTLYLYGGGPQSAASDDPGNRSTIFVATGSNSGTGSTTGAVVGNGLVNGEDYTVISGLLATAGGDISITYTRNGTAGEGVFNGLQIVPEPSSALLLLGGFGAVVVRRRRA